MERNVIGQFGGGVEDDELTLEENVDESMPSIFEFIRFEASFHIDYMLR